MVKRSREIRSTFEYTALRTWPLTRCLANARIGFEAAKGETAYGGAVHCVVVASLVHHRRHQLLLIIVL